MNINKLKERMKKLAKLFVHHFIHLINNFKHIIKAGHYLSDNLLNRYFSSKRFYNMQKKCSFTNAEIRREE